MFKTDLPVQSVFSFSQYESLPAAELELVFALEDTKIPQNSVEIRDKNQKEVEVVVFDVEGTSLTEEAIEQAINSVLNDS